MRVTFTRSSSTAPLLLHVVAEDAADRIALAEFAKQFGDDAGVRVYPDHPSHTLGPDGLKFAPPPADAPHVAEDRP